MHVWLILRDIDPAQLTILVFRMSRIIWIPGTTERVTSSQLVPPTMAMSPQPGPSHVREYQENIEELVVVSMEHFEEDEE